jgi:hypothetical protein
MIRLRDEQWERIRDHFPEDLRLDDSQKRRLAESDVDPVNAASERLQFGNSSTSADLVFPPASSMYRPSRCHRPSVDDS